MTNEEMQSTIHFILEQQAQFSVNMQKLGEAVIKLESSITVIAEKLDKLAEEHESLHRFVGAIAVAQANTEVNLARTEANLARTEANIARTEANLNALILVVEKYLSNGRNGPS